LARGNPIYELGEAQPLELELNLSYLSFGSYEIPITVSNSSKVQVFSTSLSLSTTASDSGTIYYGGLFDNMDDGDKTFYSDLGPLTDSSTSTIISNTTFKLWFVVEE